MRGDHERGWCHQGLGSFTFSAGDPTQSNKNRKAKKKKKKKPRRRGRFSCGRENTCLLTHPEVQSVFKDQAQEPHEQGVCVPLTLLAPRG